MKLFIVVLAAGWLIPAGCFAFFKLTRIVEDCREERERREGGRR